MQVEFTYTVYLTCDDTDGIKAEAALLTAAKTLDPSASIEETDAVEVEEDEAE